MDGSTCQYPIKVRKSCVAGVPCTEEGDVTICDNGSWKVQDLPRGLLPKGHCHHLRQYIVLEMLEEKGGVDEEVQHG